MKRVLTTLSMVAVWFGIWAQTPEQVERIQEIKSQDTKYFYGESTSLVSNSDAFSAAQQDMARQVKSTVDVVIVDSNDRYDCETIIKSAAAFNNVNKIEFSNENKGETSFTTFVYLSKADYLRQVEDARQKAIERIENLIEEGIYQEGKINIADALRNFNWALQLSKLYGFNQRHQLTDNRMVQSWLDDKIKSILESVEVVLEGENVEYDANDYDHYTVNLRVTYADRPVSHLDITFFNNEVNRGVMVKNGRAALKYPRLEGQTNVNFNIRYLYDDPSELEDDLARAYRMAPVTSYDKFNKKIIPVTVNQEQSRIKAEANGDWGVSNFEIAERSQGIPARVEERYKEVDRVFLNAATEGADLLKVAAEIEEALRSRDYKSVYHHFMPEALAKFQMMTNTGEISVSMKPDYKFEKSTHYVRCTSIPVSVKNGKHSRNESIVMRFDPQTRLVSSIAYALTENAENDIFRSADWMMDSRYAIVKFMEDYQTAYTTKDLDYLDRVFNGDAIIITGTVPKNKKKDKDFMQRLVSNNGPIFVNGVLYEHFTKDDFMERLKLKFAKNSYLYVKYHDAVLTRAVTPPSLSEAFWIQLKQDMNSSKANDKGYLTLQVGMKTTGSQIYTRTWTPNRLNLTKMKSLFPLENSHPEI
ncbi:MAG: hypothetical protein NC328_04625 [Muribaculum sp.]|nr:hypothetical protein [Muribaculum sp.]